MQGREEGRDAASAARAASVREETRALDTAVSYVCSDAHKDVETVKSLYDSLIRSKDPMRRIG